MKPTHPTHFIGATQRIAAILFATLPQISADPFSEPLDRCWLLTGPPGVGKTSLALALAAQVTGESIAMLHAGRGHSVESLNGQSLTIEAVRRWREDGHYIPLSGVRVKVIDEIDAGSLAAMNEIRSYLDQLPSHTLIIATSNKEPEQLQPQLNSRFMLWRCPPVATTAIAQLLSARFQLSETDSQTYALGSGGNVRAAILDAKAHQRTMAVA